ncbi:1,5-anhydro-D-fructose reductase-like [Mytilus edulis]|uniref:1,5-anhydro-D-fructose reductase-like n=1 Tax=Mytilus edulis TaxID=6550 RepID=UPI0039EFA525
MNGEHVLCEQHTLNDGNLIPVVALGTSRIPISEAIDVITTAVNIGYRHFDTSEVYENTAQIGEGIRKVLLLGKVKRKDLFITAKLGPCYEQRGDIDTSLRELLAILQLDYVDACLLHFPVQFKKTVKQRDATINWGEYLNGICDHEQVWKEMEGAVKIGLTRSIGLSNFNQQQIENILQKCTIPPAVLQTECHAHLQMTDLVKFCQDKDIFVTAFAPLGSPGLSKYGSNYKYFTSLGNSNQPCDIYDESIVLDLAKQLERTPAQILLRHLIQRGIGVLPKSSNPERLKENINIFDFKLTKCDMDSMEKLEKGRRIFSFGFLKEHPQYPFTET